MLLFTFQKSVPFFQSMYAGWVQMSSELSFISDLIQFSSLVNSKLDETKTDANLKNFGFKKIEFKNLQVGLPQSDRALNKEISFTINRQDIILLKGESGKGKSSILKFILGLNILKSGQIYIDGEKTKCLPKLRAAFVGQSPRPIDGSILEYITLRADVSETQKLKVISLLRNLGLNEFVDVIDKESVRNFSGGQLQRLAIIRAIVNDCDLLLMDEPTSALDAHAAAKVLALLEDIRGMCTIVIVTHENSFDGLANRTEYLL
jgi:ABC-type transport system involved in cytochrome bd biosynthesis fused ATPase/permease subunit